MKKVSIKLNEEGIQKLKDSLDKYKERFEKKCRTFVRECAKEGVRIANVRFSEALYTGENDYSLSYKMSDDNSAMVIAVGTTVLFIEFGTGVTYPDNHPEAHENGMFRGDYGYGMGAFEKGWRYKGDPGNLGEPITSGKHAGMVHTYGNPANMPMYQTVEELKHTCVEIARRVFT